MRTIRLRRRALRRGLALALVGALQLGCPGPGGDDDGGPLSDGMLTDGMTSDMTPADGGDGDMQIVDGAPPDGAPVDQGLDGGVDAGPDAAPLDPCDGVTCEAGERCDPATRECAPVGEPAPGEASSACAGDADCASGSCNLTVPGGFCEAACDAAGWCGSVDLRCVSVDGPDGMPAQVCADECEASGCREGWVCMPNEGGALCLPSCVEGGCGPTSYCDAATGMCAPFEGPAIAEGAPCNAQDDRCAAGLACLPDDDTGRGACRALCEPEDAPCADGAFCAVLIDAPEGEPAIGICLPDAGCDPLDPAAACGPDSACVAAPPVTLCVGVGDQALGEPCAGDRLCQPGLTCQYGRCKQPCADDRGCGDGERCIDYRERVGGPFGFCHASCRVLEAVSCGRVEECRLVDMQGQTPIGACMPRRDGLVDAGGACTPVEGTYHGDCSATMVCDAQAALRPTCRSMCTAATAGDCARGVCAQGVFGDPYAELGLCLGGCNVVGGNANCPGAVPLKCSFTGLLGVNAAGGEVLVGECVPEARRQVEPGQPCDIDPDTGLDNCTTGHFCGAVREGARPECVQLCRESDFGRDLCAVDGYACVTGIFGGNATFGACLP